MTIEQEQTLKQQFVDQAFSKKWKEKLQSKNFSDKELINYCLDKAWRDAIIFVRMRTRAEDTEILSNQDAIKGAIYNSIVNREWGDDFDRWHDEVCKKEGNGMRYGVWQKFINMSFKYLYCINDQLNKSLGIDFAKCHLPLDDNTLLWCRNNNITQVKAWNSIERGEYLKIRDWVKAFIQKNPNDFEGALQLDFIVWRIKKSVMC